MGNYIRRTILVLLTIFTLTSLVSAQMFKELVLNSDDQGAEEMSVSIRKKSSVLYFQTYETDKGPVRLRIQDVPNEAALALIDNRNSRWEILFRVVYIKDGFYLGEFESIDFKQVKKSPREDN